MALKDPPVPMSIQYRDDAHGFWMDVLLNGILWDSICFDTEGERQRATADFLGMLRQLKQSRN